MWIGVGLLGGIGAVLRVVVARTTRLGLLLVNTSGTLVLGVVAGAGVHGNARLLAAGGLLASFTTFSTWMLAADRRLSDEPRAAARLIVVSVVAGSAALLVGRELGRHLA